MKQVSVYRSFLKSHTLVLTQSIQKSERLLRDCRRYSAQLADLRRRYGFDRSPDFNVFTSISDKYQYENLHSDVLKMILDPSAPLNRTSGARNAKVFIELLERLSGKTFAIKRTDKLQVEREKHRVDVLIHDGERGIIIENKINGAVDQENQLPRYLEAIQGSRFKVEAIVYLPLGEKRPPYNYTGRYKKLRAAVDELLIVLPAIVDRSAQDGKDRAGDLAHDFLDKCCELTVAAEGTETYSTDAEVYIRHYSTLVKDIGGKIMAQATEKKLIEQILSSQESIDTMKDLAEVWNRRKDLVAELLLDACKAAGYAPHFDSPNSTVYKRLDNRVGVGFDNNFSIGFIWADEAVRLKPAETKALRQVLNTVDFGPDFTPVEDDQGWWVWRNTQNTDYPFEVLKDKVLRILSDLEKAYRSSKKKSKQ